MAADLYFNGREFPPVETWQVFAVIWSNRIAGSLTLPLVAEQLLFRQPYILNSCTCWYYAALFFLVFTIFLDRYVRHRFVVHRARLEDRSEVVGSIIEAETVEARLAKNDAILKPDNYAKKKDDLDKEVNRLKVLGPNGWTEYQVLSLNQMLVDFLKVDDLIQRAQLTLADLDDWAQGSAYTYDRKYYSLWEVRITNGMDKIGDDESIEQREENSENLRAVLRMLLEHIADYKAYWAKGSAVVRGLMIFAASAVPILILLAFTGILHPSSDDGIGVLDWGLLGSSGALTSVLLYLYRTDRVEVGNTEGKNELWRAVLGSTLGFVSGVIIYSIIKGGLIAGNAVPDLTQIDEKDVWLSIVWALGSGMYFEGVFDRMRRRLEDVN